MSDTCLNAAKLYVRIVSMERTLEGLRVAALPPEKPKPIKVPPPPKTLTVDGLMACLVAFREPSGYGARNGHVAYRRGETVFDLSIPNEHGGHWRYRVTLPDELPVTAIHTPAD